MNGAESLSSFSLSLMTETWKVTPVILPQFPSTARTWEVEQESMLSSESQVKS